jgi:FlaA1/EpsC-like NDP-sugar epimerase
VISSDPMRNRYVLLLDLPLIAFAALGAFLLRFDWFFASRSEFLPFLLASLLVKPAVFMAFGLYGRYWKYASVSDLLVVTVGVTAACFALGMIVGIAVVSRAVEEFSRSVLLIDWLLTLLAVGGLRFTFRLWNDRSAARSGRGAEARRNVLIAGAGAAGAAVLREIERNPGLGLHPVGLVDDDPVKRGKRIHGIRVLGRLDDTARVVASHDVQEVIIAMPTAPGATIRHVAQACTAAGIASRTVPGMFELLDGRVSVSRLRELEISDLLRRPEILGPVDVARYATGRTVLITGGGGSIGLELCRQLAHARPGRLLVLGHGENSLFQAEHQLRASFSNVAFETVVGDIRDRERMGHVFARHRPEIVFHAAAHKHVPMMERNPEEAITNNVIGTANVVAAALEHGTARLVLISTDKAVEPRSMMGASKRVAEQIVMQAARRSGRAFAVVRFGNVLGSRGSVVPVFKRQIAVGGPITITHPDVTRFFMTIPEAVHLVLHAGGLATRGELFVLNMREPVRITDLARDLIGLSGYAADEIEIVYTGLRPGEKLEEKLWDAGAVIDPTAHADILRVSETSERTPPVPIERFSEAARRGDRIEIEMLLAEQVFTYLPVRETAPDVVAD